MINEFEIEPIVGAEPGWRDGVAVQTEPGDHRNAIDEFGAVGLGYIGQIAKKSIVSAVKDFPSSPAAAGFQ